jgi:site-specific recombinase XerD
MIEHDATIGACDGRDPSGIAVPVDVAPPSSLEQAAAHVRELWAGRRHAGRLATRTETLYLRHLGTFLRYAAAHEVEDLDDLTAVLVSGWVDAPISAASPGSRARSGQPSADATRRGRQSVLRQVVGLWADRGWVDPDLVPTNVISKVAAQLPCPLTPAEAARLRLAGAQSAADTLLPALVAIALTGAANTEIARVNVADYDPDAAQLQLPGRGSDLPRAVPLDAHARRVLNAHVRALTKRAARLKIDLDPDTTPLALPTAPRTQRTKVEHTTVGQQLHRALKVAGIRRVGVTPGSMQDYAANQCYALTNRVEDVAALLGLVSLDAAMRSVDPVWQQTWGDTVREQRS